MDMANRSHQPRIYYGWMLMAVAVIAGSFSTGVGSWGAGVFARPMTEALGWSRASYFGALTIRSLVAGILAPLVGPLQDTRTGPRRLMLLSALILGGSLIGISYVNSLWQFYLLFGVLGGVAQVTGANALTRTILPKWFVRKRGRVLGLASMGPGFGPMLFPVSLQAIMDLSGWRTTWMVLGIVSMAVLIPLSFLVRTRPEDMGLLPDGDSSPPEPETATVDQRPQRLPQMEGLTRKESMRAPSFWLIVVSFSFVTLGMGGFHSNLVPYFQDSGFTPAVAALAATVFAICSVSVRPLWGFLAERFSVRFLLGPQLILAAGSVLLILSVGGRSSMLIAVGLHGVFIGAYMALQGVMVADYFGRAHLGAINGIMRPFQTATGAVSPLLIALLFDLRGSYTIGFLGIMMAWLMAGSLITLARPPANRL